MRSTPMMSCDVPRLVRRRRTSGSAAAFCARSANSCASIPIGNVARRQVRKRAHGVCARPRRVQEKSDLANDSKLPQLKAQRQEVVVMDPETRLGPAKRGKHSRHVGIDLSVGGIVFRTSAQKVEARM